MPDSLPDASHVARVSLVVRDLDAALGVYRDVLGFRVLERGDAHAVLGADAPFLDLVERPDAPERPPRSSGLFHVAYLLPSRADFGAFLRRLVTDQVPVDGASDHLVSEAVYLRDADGNGIEVYCDRPRAEWPWDGDGIRMATDPLDVQGVLAAAGDAPFEHAPDGTRVGHVHLTVGDHAAAEAFYKTLGLALMTRYPGASFLSAGGYHHHVAVNEWRGRGVPPAPEGAVGLDAFTLAVPSKADVDAVAARAGGEREGDALVLRDPGGNRVRVVADA